MRWFFSLLDAYGLDSPFITAGIFIALIIIVGVFIPGLLWAAIISVFKYIYIWLPAVLIIALPRIWKDFKQLQFLAHREYVLLEIRFPRNLKEGPEAMELFLDTLHNTGREVTFLKRFFKGQTRPFWSLEIVSHDDTVHFYIRSEKQFAETLTTRLCGVYQGVEVLPVPDYAFISEYDPERMGLFGLEWKLKKPDPYPIKTYLDKGVSKASEEVLKKDTDPLMHIINLFGSYQAGHTLWLQIICRGQKADYKKNWFSSKIDKFEAEAKVELERILGNIKDQTGMPDLYRLTESQKRVVDAIERSLTKPRFEVGIRGIYMANNDTFDGSAIPGLVNIFKPFNDPDLNGFVPTRWLTKYDYPWQDFNNFFKNRDKKKVFQYYRERAYFYPPYRQQPIVLTSEELATLYHLPRNPNTISGVERAGSKKAPPPTNLPV